VSKAIARKIEAGVKLSKLDDVYILVKFKLSLMVVISSCLAYLVIAGTSFSFIVMSLLFMGGNGSDWGS